MSAEHVVCEQLNAVPDHALHVEVENVMDDCVELIELILELLHAGFGGQVQVQVADVERRIRVGHERNKHVVPAAENRLQF